MNRFFDPDNFFWRWFGKLADFFLLSCLWLLCSLPILTIGTSSIALYDSVAHCVRGSEDGPCKRFFRTFKAELLRGIGITVLWLILSFILTVSYQFLRQMAAESQVASVYATAFAGSMLIPIGVLCWLLPLESRFTHKFFDLHKTAIYFAIGHLPTTAAITALLIVFTVAILFFPFLVMILPAIMVTLQSWFIERVFVKYTSEEEKEEET